MREDVLSLRAMGGDPVSEEYLKANAMGFRHLGVCA